MNDETLTELLETTAALQRHLCPRQVLGVHMDAGRPTFGSRPAIGKQALVDYCRSSATGGPSNKLM